MQTFHAEENTTYVRMEPQIKLFLFKLINVCKLKQYLMQESLVSHSHHHFKMFRL